MGYEPEANSTIYDCLVYSCRHCYVSGRLKSMNSHEIPNDSLPSYDDNEALLRESSSTPPADPPPPYQPEEPQRFTFAPNGQPTTPYGQAPPDIFYVGLPQQPIQQLHQQRGVIKFNSLSVLLAVVVCVRPSVCLFVTRRYRIKTAKRRITQTTLHDSPEAPVFGCQRSRRNLNGINPKGDAK